MNMFHDFDILGANALQELRDDNKQLKDKVEEHAVTIEKLQKGYELLDMKLRTLQTNYKSLLSGAKLAIHRKSQMIAQLKAEKGATVMNEGKMRAAKHIRRKVNPAGKHQGWKNHNKDDPKQAKDDITGK